MNKRRSSTKNTRVKLSAYKVTKKDLKNIEKMICKYISPADFYIHVSAKSILNPFSGQSYEFNLARLIPKKLVRNRPIVITSRSPNLTITFKRFSTHIHSGRALRESNERMAMDQLFSELKSYLNEARPGTEMGNSGSILKN